MNRSGHSKGTALVLAWLLVAGFIAAVDDDSPGQAGPWAVSPLEPSRLGSSVVEPPFVFTSADEHGPPTLDAGESSLPAMRGPPRHS